MLCAWIQIHFFVRNNHAFVPLLYFFISIHLVIFYHSISQQKDDKKSSSEEESSEEESSDEDKKNEKTKEADKKVSHPHKLLNSWCLIT